jgi:hypothetical protein
MRAWVGFRLCFFEYHDRLRHCLVGDERDISIEGLVRVSGGASRDTGSFDAALLENPQGDGLVRSGVTCATLAARSPTHPEKATP